MIDPEEEEDYALAEPVTLAEDICWIADPAALHPEAECSGVLAVIYRGGELFYLDGATRKWSNVESRPSSKPRPVN